MLTPKDIIHATTTQDAKENILYIKQALSEMLGLSSIDYYETISISLPNAMNEDEYYPVIYTLESNGWTNVRIVDSRSVTFRFPMNG